MTRTLTRCIAILAALALAAGAAACGDDETEGSGTEGSISAIDISIPTDTTATTGTVEELPEETPELSEEERDRLEEKGKPKIKGPTETIPGVGVLPKPTPEQRRQIAKCVEKAKGDPQKLAKCGQIVVR
jgi:hypothetical protein